METLSEWHERSSKERASRDAKRKASEASEIEFLKEIMTDFTTKHSADKAERAAKRKLKQKPYGGGFDSSGADC